MRIVCALRTPVRTLGGSAPESTFFTLVDYWTPEVCLCRITHVPPSFHIQIISQTSENVNGMSWMWHIQPLKNKASWHMFNNERSLLNMKTINCSWTCSMKRNVFFMKNMHVFVKRFMELYAKKHTIIVYKKHKKNISKRAWQTEKNRYNAP